ncbi:MULTISPECIES: hypothetical protein [Sphingobacterium]|uniref:hypothetical protein n=1 Tax=Sphingobacterium TaxID=28453 RepID=UPI0013DA4827|nr:MULTISPECIES: hypothetical protein [unclassified Sphingobacterium]
MKKLICCFAFIWALGSVKGQSLDVKIIQDGKVVFPRDGLYVLTPKSFSFEIRSTGVEGFLVGVTTDEYIYKSALGKADQEVMWFEETGMAESLFNADKEVFVSDEAPSYWYFTSAEDHRFDLGTGGTTTSWQAFRTVNSFYDMATGGSVSVKKIKKPLYFFFYLPVYDEDYNLVDKKCLFNAQLNWARPL